MPEAGPPVDPQPSRETAPRSSARGSMFQDPVVRGLALVAIGIVIVFLVTVLGAMVTGVTAPTGPRSYAEKQVALADAAVTQGSKDPAVWGTYVAALVETGQYSRAKRAIAEGKRSADDSATAEFTLAEARLLSAQKKYKESIRAGERALEQIDKAYQAALKTGGLTAQAARLNGLPENYYETVLVIAYANRELKQWDEAIKYFDIYIAKYGDASDILVDRGNAKIAIKDTAGAEKDFKTALKYIPDMQEALDGLDKIGAAK